MPILPSLQPTDGPDAPGIVEARGFYVKELCCCLLRQAQSPSGLPRLPRHTSNEPTDRPGVTSLTQKILSVSAGLTAQ